MIASEMPDGSSSPGLIASSCSSVNWWAIAAFYAIACGLSWPIFWWRDRLPQSWQAWSAPGFVKAWLPALGPALAATLVSIAFRRTYRRTVSLLGTSWVRSGLFLGSPVVVLGLLGIGDDEPHLTGLLFGLVFAVYGIGEEMGWRGFLQDALNPLPTGRRYLLIGLMWGFWHFTTFLHGPPGSIAVRMAIMSGLWVAGSFGLGAAVETSGSVFVAAALHLGFNFATFLSSDKSIPLLLVSGGIWAYLLKTWRPKLVGGRATALEVGPFESLDA